MTSYMHLTREELEAKLAEAGADVRMYRKTAQDNIASRNAAEAKLAEAEREVEVLSATLAALNDECVAEEKRTESREKALREALEGILDRVYPSDGEWYADPATLALVKEARAALAAGKKTP